MVTERHLHVVGKDAPVSFEVSLYSAPRTDVRPRLRLELRVVPKKDRPEPAPTRCLHLVARARARVTES